MSQLPVSREQTQSSFQALDEYFQRIPFSDYFRFNKTTYITVNQNRDDCQIYN